MEYSATARETKRRSTSEIERKLHSVRQTFDNCGRFAEKVLFNEGVKEERKKYNAGLISEADFLIWIEENRGRKKQNVDKIDSVINHMGMHCMIGGSGCKEKEAQNEKVPTTGI